MNGTHSATGLDRLKIEQVPIANLTPNPQNARTHTAQQVRQIARSIEVFSFTNPVLIDQNGEIVAGHGRVLAAKVLGMDSVPTIRLDHLSEAQKRAYVLADNKLALNAGWNEELLAIELGYLAELDINLDIEITGFSMAEIDIIIDSAREDPEAEDPIPCAPAAKDHRCG